MLIGHRKRLGKRTTQDLRQGSSPGVSRGGPRRMVRATSEAQGHLSRLGWARRLQESALKKFRVQRHFIHFLHSQKEIYLGGKTVKG